MMERRYADRVPVSLEVTHDYAGRSAQALATNIGYEGLQLRVLDNVLQRGDQFELEFELPQTSERVRCEVEVVYRRGRLAGLRYVYVPSEMLRLLDDYIASQLVEPPS